MYDCPPRFPCGSRLRQGQVFVCWAKSKPKGRGTLWGGRHFPSPLFPPRGGRHLTTGFTTSPSGGQREGGGVLRAQGGGGSFCVGFRVLIHFHPPQRATTYRQTHLWGGGGVCVSKMRSLPETIPSFESWFQSVVLVFGELGESSAGCWQMTQPPQFDSFDSLY